MSPCQKYLQIEWKEHIEGTNLYSMSIYFDVTCNKDNFGRWILNSSVLFGASHLSQERKSLFFFPQLEMY